MQSRHNCAGAVAPAVTQHGEPKDAARDFLGAKIEIALCRGWGRTTRGTPKPHPPRPAMLICLRQSMMSCSSHSGCNRPPKPPRDQGDAPTRWTSAGWGHIAERGFDPRTFGLWAQHANHCATLLVAIVGPPRLGTEGPSRFSAHQHLQESHKR